MDLSLKTPKKLRLEDFLRQNLDAAPAPRIIDWVDRSDGIFRILWTHQSSGTFRHDDAALFRYWAIARGKSSQLSSVDLKQSLRMALNKSPSVMRMPPDPLNQDYRYFRFTGWKGQHCAPDESPTVSVPESMCHPPPSQCFPNLESQVVDEPSFHHYSSHLDHDSMQCPMQVTTCSTLTNAHEINEDRETRHRLKSSQLFRPYALDGEDRSPTKTLARNECYSSLHSAGLAEFMNHESFPDPFSSEYRESRLYVDENDRLWAPQESRCRYDEGVRLPYGDSLLIESKDSDPCYGSVPRIIEHQNETVLSNGNKFTNLRSRVVSSTKHGTNLQSSEGRDSFSGYTVREIPSVIVSNPMVSRVRPNSYDNEHSRFEVNNDVHGSDYHDARLEPSLAFAGDYVYHKSYRTEINCLH